MEEEATLHHSLELSVWYLSGLVARNLCPRMRVALVGVEQGFIPRMRRIVKTANRIEKADGLLLVEVGGEHMLDAT